MKKKFIGPERMIKFLVEHEADINAVNSRNDSVLMLAIHSGD